MAAEGTVSPHVAAEGTVSPHLAAEGTIRPTVSPHCAGSTSVQVISIFMGLAYSH